MKFSVPFLLLCLLLAKGAFPQTLTLEDIFSSTKYREKRPENLRFMLDDNFYSLQEGVSIVRKDTKTGKTLDTLVGKSDTLLHKNFKLADYLFSADEKQVMLSGNHRGIYRRSYVADYVLRSFSDADKQVLIPSASYATFSPDGQKVAYVKDNNLYYYDIALDKHVPLTSNGQKNFIINGSTDWVYEEELEFTKAFEWSPDSKYIAYYRFDESQVPEYNMQKWEGLYPTDYRFKYPKAGQKNASVQIKVVDLASQTHQVLPLDTSLAYYVARIQWASANVLHLRTLNRLQNTLTIFQYIAGVERLSKIYGEQTNAIEIHEPLFYLDEKNAFVTTTEKGGMDKALLIVYPENPKANQILSIKGLESLQSYDMKGKWLYYSFSTDAIHKQVGRISLSSKKMETLSAQSGKTTIQISEGSKFYILTQTAVGKPATVSLYDAKTQKSLRVLEANLDLQTKLNGLKLSKQEFFHFRTGENIELNGWMIKPSNFDSTKRYPVILFTYGGPGSQMVVDDWQGSMYLWHEYLATQGFLIACVDGRGTGGRSTFFRTSTYKRLGELETKDQIEAARYLTNFPFVDRERIGIWGWSFGGYLSTNSILKGSYMFKAAIAVAPVTSWRFYDTIYTERYLSTPQDNAEGYDQNSPLLFADRLKGNYLLIHGTSDDNVHIQNTYAMQEALIKAGKQFDSFIYPNRAHGISGGNTRLHLYTMMLNFWNAKLKN